MAGPLLLAMLMFAMTGHASSGGSGCIWCVCKDADNAALQKTLDYACGAGADCVPIHQNGPCFSPNNVRAHCSYAVNSFFQRKSQAPGTCDFSGTATISTSDPSISGCSFPATLSAAAGTSTTTPVSGTPKSSNTTPSVSGTPSSTSPYTTTPSGGILGGGGINNGGVGPQVQPNNDYDNYGLRILPTTTSLLIYGMAMLVMSLWA